MTKIDPIIAVNDVERSTEWYRQIFGFTRDHGGDDFAVMLSENSEIVLCLHKWGEHGHPTMQNEKLSHGNGLILYFRTDKINEIRKNVGELGWGIEEDIHTNPNSKKQEFSMRDPDGYYISVTEFHKYEG